MAMKRNALARVLLVMICLLPITNRVGAIDINKGSLVIDIGIGYGPKCWSFLPAILAVKYFIADDVALEVFVPAAVLLIFMARPVERSSSSGRVASTPRFGIPFGVEVNYYPPFVRGYSYLSVGISRTELISWAINASLGINTVGLFELNTEELERILETYLEGGVALVFPKSRLDLSDYSDSVGTFLPDFSKRFLPNIELGSRFGGPLQ
jgi:hypothetical protein